MTLVDNAGGLRITIQKSWWLVPNSAASVRSIILQLLKTKKPGVAGVNSSILGSTNVTRYWFEAFDDSAMASNEPTITLAISRSKVVASAKGLPGLAASFAKFYAKKPQTTIQQENVVTLPEGPAAFVVANRTVSGTTVHLEIYVIPHGRRLYQLTFSREARTSSDETTFSEIARRLAFT